MGGRESRYSSFGVISISRNYSSLPLRTIAAIRICVKKIRGDKECENAKARTEEWRFDRRVDEIAVTI